MFQSEYYCNNERYNQEDLKQVSVIVNWKTKHRYHIKFLRLLLTKEAVKINSGLNIIVRWNGVASCSSDQPTMPFWNGAPRRGTTEPICQISPAQSSLLNYSLFISSSRSKEINMLLWTYYGSLYYSFYQFIQFRNLNTFGGPLN